MGIAFSDIEWIERKAGTYWNCVVELCMQVASIVVFWILMTVIIGFQTRSMLAVEVWCGPSGKRAVSSYETV